MRKLLFISLRAQEKIVMEAGTAIALQSVKEVRAADVKYGDKVDFRTIYDINIKGHEVLPAGYIITGSVMQARKSSMAGTKGRLVIKIDNLILPDGQEVPLSNKEISISGKNRTPLSVISFLFLCWPGIFIPGTKAVMPENYEVETYVLSDTTINMDW